MLFDISFVKLKKPDDEMRSPTSICAGISALSIHLTDKKLFCLNDCVKLQMGAFPMRLH